MIRLTNRLFQTHPVLGHALGALHAGFQRLCEAVWALPPQPAACDELTIITFNSGKRAAKPCGVFERSLARLGIEPVVLGRELARWSNRARLGLLAEALGRVQTPFVLAADSCDVLLFDSPAILLERYRRHFTCDLVFNATGSTCWPELPEFVRFESSLPMAAVAQGRHWLNAGVWIGRTEFAREFFTALATAPPVPGHEYSDQAIIKRQWPRWYPRVQLDYLSVMFQWLNEDRSIVEVARPLSAQQQALIEVLRPLGQRLTGAEIGVWGGATSEALLRELPALELWMIDPYQSQPGGSQPQDAFDRARDTARWWTDPAGRRRHILVEPSRHAAHRFADQALDFAYIDGNHVYEHVRDDIFAWWPKIKPGGVLTGSNCGTCDGQAGECGIRRAVEEFGTHLGWPVNGAQDGVWWVRK